MLPDTPTLIESGASDIDVPQWSALFAIEGTPTATLTKLRRSVEETLAEPDTKQRFAGSAMDVSTMSSEAFKQRIIQDRERWAKLIKARKISME
jgi:tripartite-type tricarboxylate transporter receptor subunit TctC